MPRTRRHRQHPLLRGMLLFLLALFAWPAVPVLALRWWNPPLHTTRFQRSLQFPSESPSRRWLPLSRHPPDLVWFVLLSEDSRFFSHHGLDWTEFHDALDDWQRDGDSLRGASTLTMQCARTYLLWQGRSWLRKFLEIHVALWMETLLPKPRILELYLNGVETGPAVYGFAAAARHHFHRDLSRCSREQWALLAALLPNPRLWNPAAPHPTLRNRQRRILRNASRWQRPPPLRALFSLHPNGLCTRPHFAHNHPMNPSHPQDYLSANPAPKLQLGCGDHLLPGWLNTDVAPRPGIFLLDATQPFPLPDAAFTHIYSEHMIEHIAHPAGLAMLRECRRVLRPGGRLRVATPNLAFLIDLYRTDKTDLQKAYLEWSTGLFIPWAPEPMDTCVINNFMRDWFHAFIYDEKTLRRSLTDAGFRDITRCQVGESPDPVLTGLENENRLPPGFYRLETLVLEARA